MAALGRASRFLMNLFAKGSMHMENGNITAWNNPIVFFPLSAFCVYQKKIEEIFGEEGMALLFWVGKIQGRNSSKVFIKRFGFKPNDKNIHYFTDGSSLVGMGLTELISWNFGDKKEGRVICKNSTLAKEYLKKYGKSQTAIDHYMRGILAGGAEPLASIILKDKQENHIAIDTIETKCICKGDEICEYNIQLVSDEIIPTLIINAQINPVTLVHSTKDLFLKRQNSILKQIFSKYKISFNDGKIFIDKNIGILIPTYLFAILNKTLGANSQEYANIIKSTTEEMIQNIKNYYPKNKSFSFSNVQKWLDCLDLFGYGKFILKRTSNSIIIIENRISPYARDYKKLFGVTKKPIDEFSCSLLQSLFKKLTDKQITVTEKHCICTGAQSCIYAIHII